MTRDRESARARERAKESESEREREFVRAFVICAASICTVTCVSEGVLMKDRIREESERVCVLFCVHVCARERVRERPIERECVSGGDGGTGGIIDTVLYVRTYICGYQFRFEYV